MKTLDGKPIKNATVDLKAIDADETKGKNFVKDKADPSLFSIDYFEGYSFRSFHKLTISAPGFNSTENQAKFTSCENRGVVVKLAKAGSPSPAVWQFENIVIVDAVGSDDKAVEGVKLTVIDGHKKSEDVDMRLGSAYFTLPNGQYTFRFEAKGYQTKNEKIDLTTLSRQSVKVEIIKQGESRDKSKTEETSVLTGTVYDAQGAVITGATVVAKNSTSGKTFIATTGDDGAYVLNLPYEKYDASISSFNEAKYDLKVEAHGFKTVEMKDYVFMRPQCGRMQLDIGMEVRVNINTIEITETTK